MGTKNDIGHSIKEKMSGYKASPDQKVWTAIEDQLKKDRKRGLLIWFLCGISVILLLVFGGFYISTHHLQKETIQVSDQQNVECEEETWSDNESNGEQSNAPSTSEVDSMSKKQIGQNDDIASGEDLYPNTKTKSKDVQSKILEYNARPAALNEDSDQAFNRLVTSNTREYKTGLINHQKEQSDRVENDTVALVKEEKQKPASKEKVADEEKDTLQIEKESAPKIALSGHVSYDYFGSFNHSTSDNTSFNYGFKLHYRLDGDYAIRVGLNYMNLQFQNEQSNQLFSENLEYLELPIDFNYRLLDKKFDINLSFGLSYWLLLESETRINGFEVNAETSRKNTYSLNFGIPVETQLTDRMLFFVEPSFRYWPISFENRLETQPFILSITTGIVYKF